MIKGYKIRIFPTKEQEHLIWKHIGACRFVWNYMLNLQNERCLFKQRTLSGFDMMNLLPGLKKTAEYTWLNEISNASLQRTCADLAENYKAFFNKTSKHPIFKSKKNHKQKFPVRVDRFYFVNGYAHIQKIGKVKYKTDFILPEGRDKKYTNVHVSYENGKYMLSFNIECENQAVKLNDYCMGIDLGVKELAVVAFDGKELRFSNINKSASVKREKQKNRRIHRAIERKIKASILKNGKYIISKNIQKEVFKLRKSNARITNINMNYIHQTTHQLVSLLPSCVVMEDLKVESMLKNRWLKKQVKEQRFITFIKTMKYKCERNGILFVQADAFFPSSKTCSRCGNIKQDLRLSDRVYRCDECGLSIDRDYNAAINLIKYVTHNKELQL